ncbi:DUF2252 domain-containing protein [Dactylosporangium aurantiacum]|uniref:DUF2252 domain-containing protein n=1 Tax=Dactylosporangium aurantiacum TaxID=35754 RepID=A0A9Q9MF22_9ACTN|nr:DUF2252 domain-containing protein [Dactylosporangium aurantiacum]MDG6103380.1 DUF2252 domain-containing protein [Dactylosporangium aurantiacum]UWZ52105.1 DUF2252 domain-containing protein [Dactylosporangium aurantiacum]
MIGSTGSPASGASPAPAVPAPDAPRTGTARAAAPAVPDVVRAGGWSAPEALRAEGAQRRAGTPVKALTELRPATGRDPVAVTAASNAGRVAQLVPIRIGRMISSPFAFLRGSAAVMAADLAANTADTGLHGYVCGDAHAANFGFYASPERRLVMDVNDFDETVVGPWDWDLKRLTASIVSAGREAGLPDDECRDAARDCATGYRTALAELADMPLLDAYYLTTDHSTLEHFGIGDLVDTFDRVRKKAKKNTSRRVAQKFTQRLDHDAWRFTPDPPILVPLESAEAYPVIESLDGYAATLDEEIRALFGRYAVVDVAHRIVGLGSVGYRSYVVLLHGNGDEALVLQVKQARASALAPYLPPVPDQHAGERVVRGQRWMQTVSDVLLGWTSIDGQPYLVRQFRDMKGSIDPTTLRAGQLDDYARVCGVVLARAHAQSIDPRTLSGYCGAPDTADGDEFDAAFATFAVAYADQTEADHAALVAAVSAGTLPAVTGV